MPYVATRAGRVSYQDTGQGVPVVMLHATLHDSHDFDGIVPVLARQYRTVAVDWPWHGASEGKAGTPRPGAADLADVLVDVVTGLSLPPALFIGNSVGGFCAARLAITHPDRVRGLVLVNTGGFTPWNPVTRALCSALGVPAITRRILPYLVRGYMKPRTDEDRDIARRVAGRAATSEGARTAAALWRSFSHQDHDLRGTADRITAPTLIVWGDRDPFNPARAVRVAQRSIRGSRLEEFRTGHVVFSSEPETFLSVAQPFFEAALAESRL